MGLQEISGGVSHTDGQECCAYELGGNSVKVGEDGNQFCVFNNHFGNWEEKPLTYQSKYFKYH